MEWNEQEKKLIEKAKFYFSKKLKAHVFVIPKPKFKNGLFVSKLQEEKFWWFIENDSKIPIRLFLYEVYDIEDYHEREEEE